MIQKAVPPIRALRLVDWLALRRFARIVLDKFAPGRSTRVLFPDRKCEKESCAIQTQSPAANLPEFTRELKRTPNGPSSIYSAIHQEVRTQCQAAWDSVACTMNS